ncbi:MAG: hypothetical protein PWP07_1418 [Epulopiscium sp.]|jgi:hypothetical protein|uniref:DUF3784 domain-containing protein n=1 Tax=Defluviitalea raffinosedens TaxID=1450156 RepID=A0A7C8HDH0_9FIRM|nr:hypothetical protein [Defluviitalea raffinosedens]KAE9630678.1 hypothetical protein GND95_12230 [Defluviitalea raffinosedens]MBM7686315.1 uncharacterized membrane protein YjjP (DUF1212 family) [Defluviitalea raffinosedens]MDK2788193.1 hypothetical protein [Candidatus Epulonipiscium sp.]
MMVYSIIMMIAAVLLLICGIAIQKGNTDLIHDYHRSKVKESDRLEYGKAFAKGIYLLAFTLLLSGSVTLIGEDTAIVVISVAVLLIGMLISFMVLGKVQKKFNGGWF